MPQAAPQIFDLGLAAARRAKARKAFFLLPDIARLLADRLLDVTQRFPQAALLGETTIAKYLNSSGKIDYLDILPWPESETITWPKKNYDLIVSFMHLHLANDVPGLLAQMTKALAPDGWLQAAFWGGETLQELRQVLWQAEEEVCGGVSARTAPMIDLQSAAGLLQRVGLALPVADQETFEVVYPDIFALLGDLRAAGMTNTVTMRRKNFSPRGLFQHAAKIYAQNFGAPGGVRATFQVIIFSGWRAAANQQKALLPGSATGRLADALGAVTGKA